MIWPWYRRPRPEGEREDVTSKAGKVTFNYLQQRPVDNTERPPTPLEEAGTTAPKGFTPTG